MKEVYFIFTILCIFLVGSALSSKIDQIDCNCVTDEEITEIIE